MKHYDVIIHLLGYLNKYPQLGIRIYHNYEHSPIFPIVKALTSETTYKTVTFTDSSWQDCIDSGRSTGLYAIFHHGNLIDYASFLPKPEAMSTAEAEYSTAEIAAMASAHVRYVNNDFKCLGKHYEHRNGSDDSHLPPAIILIDNTAAFSMTESLNPSSYTRHI